MITDKYDYTPRKPKTQQSRILILENVVHTKTKHMKSCMLVLG